MNREHLSIILPVLGKLLYSYPTRDFLAKTREAQLFGDIPYISGSEAFAEGQKLLEEWETSDGAYDACISDYQDLFVGVRDRVKVPIWESFFTAPEPMMFTDSTLKARLWYDRYGMEIKNIRHEPDDHMGIELMFLAYLLDKDPENAEKFFSDRIAPWYAKLFECMASNAVTPLYRGLALLLYAICEDFDKAVAAKAR